MGLLAEEVIPLEVIGLRFDPSEGLIFSFIAVRTISSTFSTSKPAFNPPLGLDTAIIIAPSMFELLKGVADSVNIDYEDGLINKNAPVDASLVAIAMKQQRERPEKQIQIEQEDIEKVEQAASLMEKPVRLKEPAEPMEDVE